MFHLFLNSNPWFSAVTDYSLQLVFYLTREQKSYGKTEESVLYCAEVGSTAMDKKCAEHHIPFKNVPLHNQGNIFNFLKSFFVILMLLLRNKKDLKFIWVFEGREHFLCVILKIFFPYLWKNKILIRVRGQSQDVNPHFFSKILYKKLTDKVICAAKCVQNRMHFNLPQDKISVHYYGKKIEGNAVAAEEFSFHQNLPAISRKNFILLVIGRFDPVKGHDSLVEGFLKSKFLDKNGHFANSQLIFLGHDATLKAAEMYKKYLHFFGEGLFIDNKYFLRNKEGNKNLFIINEKRGDLFQIITMAHYGVIPSLNSEVICRVGVEFLQHGIPVISSDVGALSEVLSDFNDWIFNAGNTEDIRNKLEYAFQFYNDNERYLLLRSKAESVWKSKYTGNNYVKLMDFVQKQD